jgi:hypothetical protein
MSSGMFLQEPHDVTSQKKPFFICDALFSAEKEHEELGENTGHLYD